LRNVVADFSAFVTANNKTATWLKIFGSGIPGTRSMKNRRYMVLLIIFTAIIGIVITLLALST